MKPTKRIKKTKKEDTMSINLNDLKEAPKTGSTKETKNMSIEDALKMLSEQGLSLSQENFIKHEDRIILKENINHVIEKINKKYKISIGIDKAIKFLEIKENKVGIFIDNNGEIDSYTLESIMLHPLNSMSYGSIACDNYGYPYRIRPISLTEAVVSGAWDVSNYLKKFSR